jgi:hypothetical protein
VNTGENLPLAQLRIPSLILVEVSPSATNRWIKLICEQCCGTVTIFYGSGSGSDFEKLWFRFRLLKKLWFRFLLLKSHGSGSGSSSMYTIKSKFFLKKLFPFYIISCFTRKKIININKFIVKCKRKKMLNEGYQIHNFISSSGSDFLTSYGSGSGSTRQKVTVPTVPVPVPQHCLR